MASASLIDPADVQGLVRFAYSRHTEACYLLVRVRDAAAARAWCATAPVATAEIQAAPPRTALQIGFTFPGLRSLGLPPEVLSGFSAEFQTGMAREPNRSRRLGDVGQSAPENWDWGAAQNVPDAVLMLFAFPGMLLEFTAAVQDSAFHDAFDVIKRLDTVDLAGYEQFGFKDGISQPQIDWEATLDVSTPRVDYNNVSAAGEFLLGYTNEYGKYTDRPLTGSNDSRAADLLPALDAPQKKDIGRNGTFVVIRTLEQDVRGFWRFLDRQTGSEPGARQQLGEKMVGRAIDGDPLAPGSSSPIPGIPAGAKYDQNRFTYAGDAAGTHCPFGAHIRRANPRNTDFPDRPTWWLPRVLSKLGFGSRDFRSDIMASTRFHRLIRRGREYGAGKLSPQQAVDDPLPPPGRGDERGLHFVCLAANINRQFEFVQNAWLMSTKFNGLAGESDPLLGNRSPIGDSRSTDNFTVPGASGLARCISGLPRFITVRGGAYFFMPGIRALRYFSRLGESADKIRRIS
ncbi:MAG TPA: peroxidase [Verrucomicrobiae bacterium]|nr:peroxidase [Verrucomicrobiae bacterium]